MKTDDGVDENVPETLAQINLDGRNDLLSHVVRNVRLRVVFRGSYAV